MSVARTMVASVAMIAGLAACDAKKADDTAAPEQANPTIAAAPANPAAAPAPASQTPVQAIQTQPGPGGTSVALERVAVTGNILTVQLRYIGGETNNQMFDIEQASVIDDATSNRIGVLKDQEGAYMASPLLAVKSDKMNILYGRDTPAIVWFKFPAPPATSATVSINIPGVAPFDGVAVTR